MNKIALLFIITLVFISKAKQVSKKQATLLPKLLETSAAGDYELIGPGDCDWHYSGGTNSLEGCYADCLSTPGCEVFTYGGSLGCRFSKCGSDAGPDPCPADLQCPLTEGQHGGSAYEIKRDFKLIGKGDCDWHYTGGTNSLEGCSASCKSTPGCEVFTYGGSLGCRLSKCGSDAGPDPCPADLQCPLTQGQHGGLAYEIKRDFKLIGKGDCDWHYTGGANSLEGCYADCQNTPNCDVFTYGGSLGCRLSKCGSDAGPDPCPADNQCPLTQGQHGGLAYEIVRESPSSTAVEDPAPLGASASSTDPTAVDTDEELSLPRVHTPRLL